MAAKKDNSKRAVKNRNENLKLILFTMFSSFYLLYVTWVSAHGKS